MKTATVNEAAAGKTLALRRSRSRFGADYAELVKARLTTLVLLTTAVGYYLAAPTPIRYLGLLHVVLGTACAAAGAAALNQWWERKVDALMERTKDRPVPAGRMYTDRRHWPPGLFSRLSASSILPSPAIVSALSSPRSRL